MTNNPLELAESLLMATKKSQPIQDYLHKLAGINIASLKENLVDDDSKKAFWINIYNAFIQIKGVENKAILQSDKKLFFTSKWILIGSHHFSFDDIEHGILRKGVYKYSLGFVKSFVINKTIKSLMVETVDYRIHFALNCGATSCPAIAFYKTTELNEQLDLATSSFLHQETHYDTDKNTVFISKLMLWYFADFGGKAGIKKMLNKYGIEVHKQAKVRFKDYDWNISLNKFAV